MGKPLYVCVTCSQDFTRGYDARRHNFKHHFGQSKIVSFLEYLIGRTNGTLPPPIQTQPRLSTKNKKKILDFCKNNEQNNAETRFTPLQDATANIAPQDPCRTPTYGLEGFGPHKEKNVIKQEPKYGLEINPSLHNTGTPSCCCEDRIRKANIKLYELEQLLSPFANPHYIKNLIGSIVRHCNKLGDYDYVEECFKNHQKNIAERLGHWYPK